MSKRSYLAIPILAALSATLPARLSAQSVAGTVQGGDLAAGPLSGAFVSLVDASGAQVDATFTDAGGAFRLEAPSSMPSEVAAIEIYTGASTMPAEFGGSSGQCGAVVIWTK